MKITSLPFINPNGAENLPVVRDGQTRRTTLAALMASVGQPYVAAAQVAADRAGQFAASQLANSTGIYPDLNTGAAAVADGAYYFVDDGTNFYSARKLGGVGVAQAAFTTEKPYEIDVRGHLFGAKGDAWQFTDGTIAAGALDRITLADTGWKPSATATGNPICIQGAGTGGAPLVTTIAGFVAPATILLTTPASAALAGASGEFGTNDRAAIQAATDAAYAIGGGKVQYGGAGWKYLLAGDPVAYGTFTDPDGTENPFPRGFLQLRSHVSHHGDGATLLVSGGRKNPPGIFFNDFWSTPDTLDNVRITGLTLDGNLNHQVMTYYPPNTDGNHIWQHGNLISTAAGNMIEVDHCRLINARGAAFRFFNNDFGVPSRLIYAHDNQLDNIFADAIGGNGAGIWIERNRFTGDGYWVAGVDLEVLVSSDLMLDSWVIDNEFDFSTGLSPVERTPQFASTSPEAQAARRHTRRAASIAMYASEYPGVSADYNGGIYNGNLGRVTFAGNKISQGVVDVAKIADVTIFDNQIRNAYEDLTGHVLIYHETINFDSSRVLGLDRLEISHNLIDSALDGAGIGVHNHPNANVHHNRIANTRNAGIVFNGARGSITHNTIRDVGRIADAGTDLPLRYQAGIYLVGPDRDAPLLVADNIAYETRSGADRRLHTAVYSNCDNVDIRDNIALGQLGPAVLENVPGHSRLIGNRDGGDVNAPAEWSVPLKAPSIAVPGDVKAGRNVTARDMMIYADAVGDVLHQTWAAPKDGGGVSIYYQWIVSTASNAMTLNRFKPGTSEVLQSPIIIDGDGTLILANTGLRIRPGALPVFADNAAALAGGLVPATIYRTPTGQVQIVY